MISNRLLFLAPKRRSRVQAEAFDTAALDHALETTASSAHTLMAELVAERELLEDIDKVISLDAGPEASGRQPAGTLVPSRSVDSLDAEWSDLDGYPRLVSLPTTTVIIPTLNEEANIGWVLQRMPAWIDEIVLVDGGSRDRTVEVAQSLRPDIRVVTDLRKGKGRALRTGFEASTMDVVVMIDADGSMDPQEIESYVRAVDAGYDLVKGSRACPGGGSTDLTPTRQLGNYALRGMVNLLFAADFTELCYGFMALRRSSIPAMELDADGFEIETQIVVNSLRRGLRIAEIPSKEAERLNGTSHLHPVRDGLRVLNTILHSRFTRLATTEAGA